jgi:protein-disulfide isomerase
VAASWGTGTRLPHGLTEDGHAWLGSEDPDLVIEEWVDYLCPHCRVAAGRTKMRLPSDPGLRIVRRHQPRMQCGKEPTKAKRCFHARAVMCAGEQGRFWEMDDWLFHHANGKPRFELEPAIRDVGLDEAAFTACMDSAEMYLRAQAEVDGARKLGILGTPGYAIDGRRVDLDELRAILADR